MNYDELKQEICEAPLTWLPGILTHVIEEGHRQKCFVRPDGASRFVAKVEERLEQERKSE